MSNLSYLFNMDYYDEEIIRTIRNDNKNKKAIEEYFIGKNGKLTKILNTKLSDLYNIKPIGKQSIYLKTTYPGLIIGSGLIHGLDVNDDVKLGFYFDYTTGAPTINGSSVKGVLRSVFEDKSDDVLREKAEYIKECIEEGKEEGLFSKIDSNSFDKEILKRILNEIFEGKSQANPMPISRRDIFFEAVIDVEESKKINKKGVFLGEDYITPHKDPLKNPIPIKFLKILPDIVFRFDFDLKDGEYLTSEDKLYLFKRILLDIGIGAKTNVGYGQFEFVKEEYR